MPDGVAVVHVNRGFLFALGSSSAKGAGVLLVFSILIVPSIIGVLFARDVRTPLLPGWSVGWMVSVLGCIA